MDINNNLKIFPSEFKYWNMKWQQSITKDINIYRYKILITSFSIAVIIPFLMLINDLTKKDYSQILNYIIPMIIMGMFLGYVIRTKNVKIGTSLALISAILGFSFSLILPKGEFTAFSLFIIFPVLVFQIKGLEKGLWWIRVNFFIVVILCILIKLRVIIAWSNNISFFEMELIFIVHVLLFFLSYFEEIQHEKYLNKFLKRVNFDHITNLPNRDVLLSSINDYEKDLFIIIRILNFNDLISLFGYEVSDMIISFVGIEIQNLKKEFSIEIFKLLSNDFGIIFSEKISDHIILKSRLKEFLTKLERKKMKWESKDINLVYGMGVCNIAHQNFDCVLSKADQSLKEGLIKNNRLNFHVKESYEKKRCLESLIKFSCLVENRNKESFLVEYQPIVNTQNENIEWYEALLRVKNGDRYESIYSYLNIAKSTGFYSHITETILKKSCEFIMKTGKKVSINISVIDIVDFDFFNLMEAIVCETSVCCSKIILEIVETEEIKDKDKIIKFINKAKKVGISVALDDFGSGYSNFLNIINYPFDIVKIDGRLIKNIVTDESTRAMVESITVFCKKMNRKIVAEYIETYEILEIVRKFGIDYSQGYYLAKAKPMNEIIDGELSKECIIRSSF